MEHKHLLLLIAPKGALIFSNQVYFTHLPTFTYFSLYLKPFLHRQSYRKHQKVLRTASESAALWIEGQGSKRRVPKYSVGEEIRFFGP